MSSIIQKKIQDSEKILALFEEYLQRLEPLITYQFDVEYSKLQEILKSLPKIKNKIEDLLKENHIIFDQHKLVNNVILCQSCKITFEKGTYIIFTIYHTIQHFYMQITYLFNTLDQGYLLAPNINSDIMSKTYKMETMDYFNKLKLQYQIFLNKHAENDLFIVQYLAHICVHLFKLNHENDLQILEIYYKMPNDSKLYKDYLYAMDNIITSIKYIQKTLFYSYKNTVNLYAVIMQKLLDYHKGPYKHISEYILSQIEKDKDFLMSGYIKNTLKTKDIHLKNPPYKRFGLMPLTDLMPWKTLITKLLNNQITGRINLKQYAKKNNLIFILMYHITYTPIQYYLNKLLECSTLPNKEYGLTQSLIDKYDIIKILPTQANDAWDIHYEIIGELDNPKSTQCYIIESINHNQYRALAPWIYGNNNYSIPKHKLEQLIQFIKNPNEPNRIANYHTVAIQRSIENMFLLQPLSVKILEENAKEIDIQLMQNDVYLKIMKVIRYDIIYKKYDDGKKILTHRHINEILHDSLILDTFIKVILSMFKVGTKLTFTHEYSAGKFPLHEILVTYIKDLQDLATRFMKELHDQYNKNPLSDTVFRESLSKKNDMIIQHLEQILTKIIQIVLNNKDNIYATLNYKYLLLNFH